MTCAGRSRSRSLALLVSARTCCTWSSGKVLAITPRLIRSLRRMPAGRPERARAIVAARPRESASMTQLHHYVNSIGASPALISASATSRRPGSPSPPDAPCALLRQVAHAPLAFAHTRHERLGSLADGLAGTAEALIQPVPRPGDALSARRRASPGP